MEWTVVTVLITLSGLIIAIMTPLLKLNSNIVRLSASVDVLTGEMEKYTAKNDQSHDKLWKKNEEQDATLDDHEHRLTILEVQK